MKRMKSSISAGMTRSFQIAITTSLILIVTISLVTNQVLAVEVVNTNPSSNSLNSATSTVQMNDNPTFRSRVQDRIDKFLQYKNGKTDSKLNNLKTFLQSSVEERKSYIETNLKLRLDKLDKITAEDKVELQNYIASVISTLDLQSANITNSTQLSQLTEIKDVIYSNSKIFLVEGPKIHFKIEAAKLKFYKLSAEKVQTELGTKITELENSGADASTLKELKAKLDNQILALNANIADVNEKIDQITKDLSSDQLKNAKESVRDALTKSYETIKIIKTNLSDIANALK